MKIFNLLNRAGLNAFFFLLIGTVCLAWLFPGFGTTKSPLPLKPVIDFGVSVIFFFYGLKLNWSSLVKSISHYKLHLVIQGTTFILFPMIIMVLGKMFPHEEYQAWWVGTFYLAALPSTVSSSVVMVSIAGGNLSAAIFNASISSLIGIFVTPLWMRGFLTDSSGIGTTGIDVVIITLSVQVLLPVLLGLMLHKKLGALTGKYKDQLRFFDQMIILLIVYRAFCESFAGHMFSGHTLAEITTLGLIMLSIFIVMAFLMNQLALWMQFSREDRITILFCGSKKSLVQGAVMGQVLFTNAPLFAMILLPLMLYHALQLLAGSLLAQRFARNTIERINEVA